MAALIRTCAAICTCAWAHFGKFFMDDIAASVSRVIHFQPQQQFFAIFYAIQAILFKFNDMPANQPVAKRHIAIDRQARLI